MGLQRARSLRLNRGVKPLAPAYVRPQFDEITAENYHASLETKLEKIRLAIAESNTTLARIHTNALVETAKRVGSWVYHGHNTHAARIWGGRNGWAARLLKLELEFAGQETMAARAAHEALRPLVSEICAREHLSQEQ